MAEGRKVPAVDGDGDVAPRIVVFSSPDVGATIGRPGLLEARVGRDGVVREPACRSDVLLQRLEGIAVPDLGPVPGALRSWLESATRTAAAAPTARLVVLSLHTELIGSAPLRHRRTGWLGHPPVGVDQGQSPEARSWLDANFEPAPELTSAASSDNIAAIARLLVAEGRSVLIFTVSTYDPTDHTHRFKGVPDTFAVRANRAIARLEKDAAAIGMIVVDVDGAVAELGAAEHVPAPGELSRAAADFVTEDTIAAIDESGALGGSLQAPVMRVAVPAFDRRTTVGTLVAWHVAKGGVLKNGDKLFDVRFDSLVRKFDGDEKKGKARKRRQEVRRAKHSEAITVTVVAGSDAILHEILVAPGSRVAAGDVSAVVTTNAQQHHVDMDEIEASFRVGVRLAGE